jgi:hypothetical protein
VHARHSHKLQLVGLQGDSKTIMEQLIDSKEPMTAGEPVAFRFFEARVAGSKRAAPRR